MFELRNQFYLWYRFLRNTKKKTNKKRNKGYPVNDITSTILQPYCNHTAQATPKTKFVTQIILFIC